MCRKAAEAGGDESKCSQRDKLTVQPCNDFLCPQWKTGDWSEVSAVLVVVYLPLKEEQSDIDCTVYIFSDPYKGDGRAEEMNLYIEMLKKHFLTLVFV